MLAITVKQPWADAIADGIKPVENRKWSPRKGFGEEIAIHAAIKFATDNDAPHTPARYLELAGDRARPFDVMPRGKIVGVGTLVGAVHLLSDRTPTKAVGYLTQEDLMAVVASRWTTGPWALVLRNVQRLREPLEVKGHLQLWKLPVSVEADIRAQLQRG